MNWKTYSTKDFEQLSWHDAMLHGVAFDFDNDDEPWKNEITFDLDFLHEWLLQDGGTYRFAICPASLTFHAVKDLHVDLRRAVLCGIWIMELSREPAAGGADTDPPRYLWTMELDEGSKVRFSSSGFTQLLLSEPAVGSRPHLSRREREGLIGQFKAERP